MQTGLSFVTSALPSSTPEVSVSARCEVRASRGLSWQEVLGGLCCQAACNLIDSSSVPGPASLSLIFLTYEAEITMPSLVLVVRTKLNTKCEIFCMLPNS